MLSLRRLNHQRFRKVISACNFSAMQKYDRNAFLNSIHIKTFSVEEINSSFDQLKSSHEDHVVATSINKVIADSTQNEMTNEEVNSIASNILKDLDADDTGEISRESFHAGVRLLGARFDSRVRPIVGCYLMTGVTIGIIVPCMPLLVSELHITSTQFGLIVSSFGVAKLFGNIPAAHYVNILGRKPLFFSGLGLASVAIGGMGLSLNPAFGFPWIICCRTLTGLGVSAIMAGGNMMVADISTALNRAQTQAPLMSAWQLGFVAGPGLGGIMIDSFGLAATYYSVGVSMLLVTAISQMFVQETKPHLFKQAARPSESALTAPSEELLSNSVQTAVTSWKRQWRDNVELRHVVLLNGSYWAVMAGVQMTMLPLLMVNPTLDMSASQIGFTFISWSLVSLAVAQPLAYLADNYDKHVMFVGGCSLLTCSSLCVPYAATPTQLALLMVPFAIGSAVMQSLPTAHVVNICEPEDAPQAMSLLRTVGDLGLIAGAASSGFLAAHSSVEAVIQGQSSILLATLAYIGYQRYAAAGAIKSNLKIK
jgi:MFS family permease